MGNTSTFGTFTMARLGIYVSQHALNVTGNNISNINTKGYTRQQLDQSSMYFGGADRYQSRYDVRENGGVLAKGVAQTRDMYLDIRYRNEMTRVGEADKKLDGLRQLDAIFDEVAKGVDGEGVLEARFNDLIQQLEEMLKDENAGNDDIDALVRSSAEALSVQFNSYAKQLDTFRENEIAQFKQELDATNATLTKIRDLNETIRKTQIFGGSGLTLKDERNLLIDQLSEKIGINVIYEMEDMGDGVEVEKLKITTSGEPPRTLIDGIYGAQLSIAQRGEDVPQVDKDGKPIMSGGKPVYDKQNVDGENFDLMISELSDARGALDPADPNKIERVIRGFHALEDEKNATTFATKEEADAVAKMLNGDPAYVKDPNDSTKGFYYHVYSSNGTDDTTPPFVIHMHPTNLKADGTPAGPGEAGYDESTYKFTNIDAPMVTKLYDTELCGGLQAMREMLTEAGEYTTANRAELNNETSESYDPLHYDPDAGSKRGIPYYQKALDNLANTFARLINEANTLGDKDIYITNKDGKFLDADGKVLADQTDKTQFVVKEGFEKYFEREDSGDFKRDADGNLIFKAEYEKFKGGPLFSNSGNGNDTEGITAMNISIANDWAHGRNHVLRSKDERADVASRLQDNVRHIITVMTSEHVFENEGTGSKFEGTFQEMLTDTIAGTLAKDENITETMLMNYNTTADELYVDRDSVMGVDLNDEAMNMMQFQKAYSAACRLMTTYDTMLEKLINGTAM